MLCSTHQQLRYGHIFKDFTDKYLLAPTVTIIMTTSRILICVHVHMVLCVIKMWSSRKYRLLNTLVESSSLDLDKVFGAIWETETCRLICIMKFQIPDEESGVGKTR